jgi:hypothetical protein
LCEEVPRAAWAAAANRTNNAAPAASRARKPATRAAVAVLALGVLVMSFLILGRFGALRKGSEVPLEEFLKNLVVQVGAVECA